MRLFILLLLMLVTSFSSAGDMSPKDKESLGAWLTQLGEDFRKSNNDGAKDVLSRMLPNKKDLETLFPGYGTPLWRVCGPEYGNLLGLSPLIGNFYVLKEGETFETFDMRKEGKVPKSVAVTVPVFRLMRFTAKDRKGNMSYVKVNGKWRWIKLRRLADMLEKMKPEPITDDPEKMVDSFKPPPISAELKKTTDRLLLQLNAESYTERNKAQKEMGDLDPGIISYLEKHLSHPEPEIRERLPKVLTAMYDRLDFSVQDIKLSMVAIAPGSFMMGSIKHGEGPVHKVTISQMFWMGKAEVTQGQYRSIVDENPSHFKGDNLPVDMILRQDAITFCNMLTEREQNDGRLPDGKVYRLPTEAEWEYCCRAGSATKYFFSDEPTNLGEYCWYSKNSDNKTHTVATKKPNSWGLYDMYGNVIEWCNDWYTTYPAKSVVDPTGPAFSADGTVRGGTFDGSLESCNSTYRVPYTPTYPRNNMGFRIVLGHRLGVKE